QGMHRRSHRKSHSRIFLCRRSSCGLPHTTPNTTRSSCRASIDITADQLQRVQEIAEMLRQQGASVVDYLGNGVLFPEFELSQEQSAVLLAIAAGRTQRTHDDGQQSLFGE